MKTREQLESELQAAQQQLRDLKLAHNVFLHKISHDLKTPSNEIIGSLSQLALESPSAEQSHDLRTALKACMRLDHLLDQLLTLDDLVNQRARVNRTEFDLHTLIKERIQITREHLEDLGKTKLVELKTDWSYPIEKLNCVIGDKEKLTKILTELLLNASDHTAQGSITLKVACIEEGAANIALEISISDTGSGIAKDRLDTIFTPFAHYVDFFNADSDKVPLSLMLCQKLVHLMLGTFTIDSTLGKGSCATIRMGFPVARGSTHLRPHQPQRRTQGTYIKSTDKPILIVDDNPVNRNVLTAITRRLGFETKQAANGQEALNVYAAHDIALIFMDCQMPVLNGFEATQAIRKLNKLVPIIAVTANTTDDDIQKCLICGMDDFIAKPITPNKIGHALSRWLSHEDQRQSELKNRL